MKRLVLVMFLGGCCARSAVPESPHVTVRAQVIDAAACATRKPPTARLSGCVFGNEGEPAAGATVVIDDHEATITDEDGWYSIAAAPGERALSLFYDDDVQQLTVVVADAPHQMLPDLVLPELHGEVITVSGE
jgi:hypothetical protein